jgi:hypothetical protein
MECGLDFGHHLHNGDSLSHRTHQVPAGRPPGPGNAPGGAYTWEESAIDAIRYEKMDRIHDWCPERVAYALESYNGWGSRNHGVPSAYLWSYSNHYIEGKYIRDHEWSASAVSSQAGGMPILMQLMLTSRVNFEGYKTVPNLVAVNTKEKFDQAEGADQPAPKALVKSKIAIGAGTVGVGGASVAVNDINDSLQQLQQTKESLDSIGLWDAVIHSFAHHKMIYLGIIIIVIAGFVIYWRWRDHGAGHVAASS